MHQKHTGLLIWEEDGVEGTGKHELGAMESCKAEARVQAHGPLGGVMPGKEGAGEGVDDRV